MGRHMSNSAGGSQFTIRESAPPLAPVIPSSRSTTSSTSTQLIALLLVLEFLRERELAVSLLVEYDCKTYTSSQLFTKPAVPAAELENVPFGNVQESIGLDMNRAGLGANGELVAALTASGEITLRAFSVDFGTLDARPGLLPTCLITCRRKLLTEYVGSVVFGGVDLGRFSGPLARRRGPPRPFGSGYITIPTNAAVVS
jgi:hypothetical protein